MKRKALRILVCMLLALTTVLAPLSCASASSRYAYIMKVNVSNARLREGAGNTDVVAKLRRGEKVLYWGSRSGSYYEVGTADGDIGYIYKDFLSNYGTVKKSMVYVTEERTTLYKKSGSSMRRSSSIGDNTLVLVYARNDGWAKVRTTSGKSGYCKLSSLKALF